MRRAETEVSTLRAMIRPFRNVEPDDRPSAYIDESAQVIGDVVIGAESSIWMNAVVRGDVNSIRIGRAANIQDGAIVHVDARAVASDRRRRRRDGRARRDAARLHDRGPVPDRHGRDPAERLARRERFDRRGRDAASRRHGRPAAVAGDGQSREGQARAHRRRRWRSSSRAPPTTCNTASITWIRTHSPRMIAAQTQPARGMRDFLPDDVRRREYVIGVIADVYQRYGFEPLETPAVENIETLLGKYGEEGNRLIFKILKRGEERAHRRGRPRAALRPDGAAGARRRRAPRQAAEVLQALPDSAGLARRPAREGPLPRVLSVRRRRVGSTSPVVEVGAVRGRERRAVAARLRATSDPPESPRGADGLLDAAGVPSGAARHGARRDRQARQDRRGRRRGGADARGIDDDAARGCSRSSSGRGRARRRARTPAAFNASMLGDAR